MSLLVAIDVGVVNLGLCVYDMVKSQVVHWENVALVPTGRYIPSQNVRYVREFIARYEHLFAEAMHVVVERQMRCNMRVIEALLQHSFWGKCTVVSPRSVKAHYYLSMNNYRENKQAAVRFVDSFVHNNPGVLGPLHTDKWRTAAKKDDLADALLLVLYYLDTYSNQLEG